MALRPAETQVGGKPRPQVPNGLNRPWRLSTDPDREVLGQGRGEPHMSTGFAFRVSEADMSMDHLGSNETRYHGGQPRTREERKSTGDSRSMKEVSLLD